MEELLKTAMSPFSKIYSYLGKKQGIAAIKGPVGHEPGTPTRKDNKEFKRILSKVVVKYCI